MKITDTMRVNAYPHSALIVALILQMPMNKGMQSFYEGMRAKQAATFI
jgi:hypothetical protein